MNDVRALLDQLQPGGTLKIFGYTDSEGLVKDLVVKKLPDNGYRQMQEDSVKILEQNPAPVLAGFDQKVAQEARDAVMGSLTQSLSGSGPKGPRLQDLVDSPLGGYSFRPADTSVYIVGLESVESTVKAGAAKEKKSKPLTLAKEALKDQLLLPVRKYIHMLKLEPGKFDRVEFGS